MVIGQIISYRTVHYKVMCLFSSMCIKASESWSAKEEKDKDEDSESEGYENGSSTWTTSWTSQKGVEWNYDLVV